LWFISNY